VNKSTSDKLDASKNTDSSNNGNKVAKITLEFHRFSSIQDKKRGIRVVVS
jgi:hypothetical protein